MLINAKVSFMQPPLGGFSLLLIKEVYFTEYCNCDSLVSIMIIIVPVKSSPVQISLDLGDKVSSMNQPLIRHKV